MSAFSRFENALNLCGCKPMGRADHLNARCPAHDDRTASLSVDYRDGKVLVKCHAGCAVEEVLDRMGLTFEDLFDSNTTKLPDGKPEIVATYNYRDEQGKLLYQVLRMYPKAFRQRRPIGYEQWEWSVRGVRRVPYRLPELLAGLENAERILIVEGEKDVDRLVSEGFVATCNSGGARKFLAEFAHYFKGANVVILPDNDEAGRNHARRVAEMLSGVTNEIRIIGLPGLAEHGDVSSWLGAGGDVKQLLTLIESTATWESGDDFADAQEGTRPEGKTRDGFDMSSPWDEPIPLPATRDSVQFCPGVFGDLVADFVMAVATETATRVDLPAIAALGVVSAVIAGAVVVEVHAGWHVPVNLYTNVLVAPGEGKSPVLAKVGRPLALVEQERQDRITPLRVATQSRLRIAEGRLKKLEKAAADAPPEERLRAQKEALQAAEEVAAIKVPAIPRVSTRDATPEALVQLIAQQGGRIAVVTDEGSEFFQMASRYSGTGKANFGIYIDGWDAKRHASDRVGRESIVIKRATLSVCLFGQPIVLVELAADPQMAGRGLLSRFLWSLPSTMVGFRPIDGEPVSDVLVEEWSGLIVRLAREAEAVQGTPIVLPLSPAARVLWDAWREQHEPRLRSDSGDLSSIAEWGSKLPGQALRLAGNLHALRTGHMAGEIDDATMSAALTVADYFTDHALKVFAKMKADPGFNDAALVLRWLQERGIYEFSKRDIYKSKEWDATRTTRALELLADYGWVRPSERVPVRGRPKQQWERNPNEPGQNWTKLGKDLVLAAFVVADDDATPDAETAFHQDCYVVTSSTVVEEEQTFPEPDTRVSEPRQLDGAGHDDEPAATAQDRCASCGELVTPPSSSAEFGWTTVCTACSEAGQ
jgi:putative DNA primase/helicase